MQRGYKALVAALVAVCLCLSACALAEGYFSELAPAPAASLNITATIPPENENPEGISPLTGERWSGTYRPILVNVDTSIGGWPHWGLSSADIIYEMPLHSNGSTRMAALFMTDIPAAAGPVRSARVPMASLREMWDSAWVFYGWQNGSTGKELEVDVDTYCLWLHDDARQNGRWVFPFVEGTERNYADLFQRVNDSNHVAPHNVQINMKAVEALFPKPAIQHPFKFTDEGLDHGDDVNFISVVNREAKGDSYISEFYYDELTGMYQRYRNGQPDYDALNGMPLMFSNVIVLRTNVTWFNNNNSRPVIQYVGQGTCDIFQNGKYIRGTWVHGDGSSANNTDLRDLSSRMVFLDDYGEELEMKVGKTFIQVVNNDMPVTVASSQQIFGSTLKATPAPTPTPAPTRTPRPTRTPKAGATPAPVEEVEEGDQEFTFGG